VDSNQNNETGKPATDDVAANEQNILPADISPPAPLENQSHPPEITPPQTQPPMEVHHHGHVHEKKKWKEYLFQFLMLFLAVFCGFLAEYKLEHTIEHNREREFITTLVEDLKTDTAQLTTNIQYKMWNERMIDSLVIGFSQKEFESNSSDLYYYARNLFRPLYFFPNDRTILQLKHAGGMRMIRKISVSDSIMNYDQQVGYISSLYEDERTVRQNFRENTGAVFDGKIFYSMFDSLDLTIFRKPSGSTKLLTQDVIAINKVITSVQILKAATRGIRIRQELLKNTATRLILFLQKEYHLK
jgi:hypothetical protein